MLVQSQVRAVSSRQPAARSARKRRLWRGSSSRTVGSRARNEALAAKLTASIAYTQPAPKAPTRRPEIAGPAMPRALRESTISAFACWGRAAVHRCQDGKVPDLGVAGQQEHGAEALTRSPNEVGREHHPLARQAIGPDASDEHQRRAREELRGKDDPDLACRARDLDR